MLYQVVTGDSRDNVKVRMRDSLTGCGAAVLNDVDSFTTDSVLHSSADLWQSLPKVTCYFIG
jgi:hypothetical protein